MNNTTNFHKIRPSARIIRTIGGDLVKDKFSAIVELVKNSYDADSPYAHVDFEYFSVDKTLKITVSDSGLGMSHEQVINKWLVPATSDKLERKFSPSGRPLQGRKGIGRFSAAALGQKIQLTTCDDGITDLSLLLDLNKFTDSVFLEDIDLAINQRRNKNGKAGTTIEIWHENIAESELATLWGQKVREKLLIELRKLLAPEEIVKVSQRLGYTEQVASKFEIVISYKGFPDIEDGKIEVQPFRIMDLYDYRIRGEIDSDGNARLQFHNQNIPSILEENIEKKIFFEDSINLAYPGNLIFDIRVFDRDPESIDELIRRGLKDPDSRAPIGKRKAREILDQYYGVSLFRGQFRVRPYGDQEFDWLELDKKRVQKPSFKIGHNQVIGFVNIQPEEQSSLEEKSARDGLVENSYYEGLKQLIWASINELEVRRFSYRQKAFKGRTKKTIESEIEDLFDFSSLSNRISKKIKALNVETSIQKTFAEILDSELETEREKKADELKSFKETIALYQGQATLGKVTHVVLHEGRKHIKVIGEYPPRILTWLNKFVEEGDSSVKEKIQSRAGTLVDSAKAMSYLFRKIEPMAISRRPTPKQLLLAAEVRNALDIFEHDLSQLNLSLDIEEDLSIFGTSFDVATIIANLAENSIYWMKVAGTVSPEIAVESIVNDGQLEIWFNDNGPGFQGSNIELMFEPGYSMKPNGTGLGLALVGDAVSRLNGEIRAVESSSGACFVLTFKEFTHA